MNFLFGSGKKNENMSINIKLFYFLIAINLPWTSMLQWENNSNKALASQKCIRLGTWSCVTGNKSRIVIHLFLWGNLKAMFNRFLLYLKWIPQLSAMFFLIKAKYFIYFIYQDNKAFIYLFIWYGILSHSINNPASISSGDFF